MKKGKAHENRTKEGRRTRVRTSGGVNTLLASPIYIGQAQGEEKKKKHIKRGAKIELGLLFILLISVWPPSCLEDVFFFACQIKLSCNTEL